MQLHKEFAGRGVQFLGLTDEGAGEIEAIEQYAERLSIPWPLGYGATRALAGLKVPGYPTTFVVGRDGKVVWNSFRPGTIEGAIRKSL